MAIDVNNLTPEVKKKLEERARCKTDKLYLAEVLGYDFQPDVHAELFEQFIQYDESVPWAQQSEKTKRLILWPRGHFKTYAVHVAVIQAIINFPDIRILLMQFGLKNTQKLMKAIMAHFLGTAEGSRFRELFPEFCSSKLGNKKELEATPESFTTPARKKKQLPQATITCSSAKSGKTGQHYDIAFVDDLICDQNYKSDVQLAKAEEDFHMAMPLLDPPFYVVVTGTRYAFGDLYENIIRADINDRKWTISVKTCWTDDGKDVRFTQRSTKDGRLIGFTREILEDIALKTPGMFASQYLNKPASTATEIFTEKMLNDARITADKIPALSPTVLFVDCASSDSSYSDDSVIVAGKLDSIGRMYVVDVDGGTWLPDAFATHVIQMTLKHRPLKVMIEKTASGVYLETLLRVIAAQRGVLLPIEMVQCSNVQNAKGMRISALAGYLRTHRLFFLAGLPKWEKMVEQFTKFTGVKTKKHDDYPDAVGYLAQEFAKNSLIAPPPKPITDVVSHLIQQTEANGMKSMLNSKPNDDGWGGAGSDFGY